MHKRSHGVTETHVLGKNEIPVRLRVGALACQSGSLILPKWHSSKGLHHNYDLL